MMMTLRRLVPAAALLAVLVACGSSSSPTGGGTAPPKAVGSVSATPTAAGSPSLPSPGAGHSEDEPHDEDEPHEGSITAKYSKDSPPPSTFRPPDTGDSTTGAGRLSLEMRTDPGCAEVGKTLTVTIRTKPGVQVAILSNIPREDGKMEVIDGRADARGLWRHVIRIPARATPGNYDVMAAAADDRGDDGGRSGSWLVVVAEPGGCR